jgi:RHS repeat-associated protein
LVAGKVGTGAGVLVGSDGHHDVTHLFTTAGAVSGSRLFDPFGAPTATGGTFGVPVGFQGDYTSPVTGDVWMGARWYRPGTASFTSRDTVQGQLVTPVSANRYTYAWADPLGMWDPDGREPGCGATAWSRVSCSTVHRAADASYEKVTMPLFVSTSSCTRDCTSLVRGKGQQQVTRMTVANFKRLSKDEQWRFAKYQIDLCSRVGIGAGDHAQLGELAVVAGSFDTCDRWAREYKSRGGDRCSFDLWGGKCFSVGLGAEAVWDAKWDIALNSVTLGLYDCANRTGSYITDSSAPSSDAAWAIGSCAAAGLQLSSLSAAGSSAGIVKSTATRTSKTRATNTARGGAGPVRVGQQGLDALGVTQNTTRIALPGGGYRVPDILDEAAGVIGEVKNVQSLSYTSQLRDYVAYAQSNQLQFDLYVRGSTQLSGPLQQAVDDGLVNLWRSLPG